MRRAAVVAIASGLAVIGPTASAGPPPHVAYRNCREITALVPTPVSTLQGHVPKGFTPQTVGAFLGLSAPVSDVPVGAYSIVTLSCAVGRSAIIEQELTIPVNPPAGSRIRGAGADFFVLDAVTNNAAVIAAYASWCAPLRKGALDFAVTDTPAASFGQASGSTAATVSSQVASPMSLPAGITGLYWKNRTGFSVLKVNEPPASLVAGSAAVSFANEPPPDGASIISPALGAHLSYPAASMNIVSPVKGCRARRR